MGQLIDSMNVIHPTIFVMDAPAWRLGFCWLCEEAKLLKFRDLTLGQCICPQCAPFLRFADRVLLQAVKDGLRVPTKEEAGSMPNR